MTPYTYLIKHTPTGRVYYGVRYAKGCTPGDLWKTYFTSSSHVHSLIDSDGVDSFEFEIRQVFDNATRAREWEARVLKRLKVVARSNFINKTDNVSIDPLMASKAMKGRKGVDHPAYGKKRPHLSARNSTQVGELNPMYGKRGELAPCYGRTGELHPMFGKTNPGASHHCKEIVTCPHCNKSGGRSGMRRWHFNYCKLKGE